MMDANQVWEVDEAIANMRRLAEFDPWWIEEPTSPDDILGHAAIRRRLAPIGVATGEHCHNRVMFKQLLQAQAIDFCQIDSCRLGGLNEVLVVLLMAAKFGVPVCPHAGGVGLCEYVQHISLFDYVCVSASLANRVLEYVDHLHEHFIDPVVIRATDAISRRNKVSGYSITRCAPSHSTNFTFRKAAAYGGHEFFQVFQNTERPSENAYTRRYSLCWRKLCLPSPASKRSITRKLVQRRAAHVPTTTGVDSGSWTESTYRANESDFQRIKLRQRVAVNMAGRSTRTKMVTGIRRPPCPWRSRRPG